MRSRFRSIWFQKRHKVGKASVSVESQWLVWSLLGSSLSGSLMEKLREKITIKNQQRKYPINLELASQISHKLYDILEISNLNISISIVGNAAMRKSYQDAFGVSKTTDILSWAPEDYIHGSKYNRDGPSTAPMIICPDYIHKRLVIDQEYYECGELDLSDDKGVSKTMATMFTVQERIPLLLIHGMLHLIGHNHETDEDWIRMTDKEDQILEELKRCFPQGLKL